MSLCEVAAHYLPWWHSDPRLEQWHGKGWSAWELLLAAHPRFENHRQPVKPAWGRTDDSDPHFVIREIDLAADHGVCSFLYHWYHDDEGPFLNDALDHGFLAAANADRMKFGIVWDNRDILAQQPALLSGAPGVLSRGVVKPQTFEAIARIWVERYFEHPSYLKIDGCPYLAIVDLVNFVRSMGGIEGAREALEGLQLKAAGAGLPGLHICGMLWRLRDRKRWEPFGGVSAVTAGLPLDSVAATHFMDHYDIGGDTFPRGSYGRAVTANVAHWESEARGWAAPYVPNVTIGFDATPLCCPTDRFERREFPFLPVLEGNTPAAVRSAMENARAYIQRPDTKVRMVTISSWNDWLTGASLLPDEAHGECYLEMLKRVFAREIVPTRSAGSHGTRAPHQGAAVNSARPPVGSR
ncbi:MAG TPA: glycoside hydrolase family 99-like domain-containing protein [Phycisphaerae bacterium]|nr:glycoside hydrolase family 99-like domain-containing protein [Phycisphaerae bacterium]